MPTNLQIRRGLQSALPTGLAGEPLFTTDTKRLYISDGTATNLLQGAATLLTTGAIPFSNANGKLTMNASNLYWDDTNNRLGIGTATPSFIIDAVGGDARFNNIRVGLGGNGSDTLSTAVGAGALNANTSGIENTAIGYFTLSLNISGSNNTALGYFALRSSTQASNTAIGSTSFYNLTSGQNNTALGRNSARYIADGSTSLTIAQQSIFIGAETKALADSQTNQIVIGYNAIGLGSNSVVLGNSSITLTALRGNVLINTTTDAGYKLDVNGTAMLRGIVYGVGSTGTPIQLLTTVGTGTALIGGNAATPLRFQGQNIQILAGSTQVGQFFATTGNLLLQNGGTFTDAGYRLDVVGTARITGSVVFNSAITVGGASAFTGSMVIGNNSITEASAKLEVRAITQGFLPPRMTTTQKNAIASPATGLMVYDTTLNLISVYNGTIWISL
jgi:hypothetical protein